MSDGELALELRARRLERQTIARVHYQVQGWGDPPTWPDGGPHSVDLAVVIETGAGQRFRIGWTSELGTRHGHGIGIDPIRVIDRDAGPVHDVTELEPWRARVGRPIRTATVHWRDVADSIRSSFRTLICVGADHITRTDYPQAIEIDVGVAGRPVMVSAARIEPDGTVVGYTNNLLVTA